MIARNAPDPPSLAQRRRGLPAVHSLSSPRAAKARGSRRHADPSYAALGRGLPGASGRRDASSGFTLAEAAVTLFLSGMLGLVLVASLVSGTRLLVAYRARTELDEASRRVLWTVAGDVVNAHRLTSREAGSDREWWLESPAETLRYHHTGTRLFRAGQPLHPPDMQGVLALGPTPPTSADTSLVIRCRVTLFRRSDTATVHTMVSLRNPPPWTQDKSPAPSR